MPALSPGRCLPAVKAPAGILRGYRAEGCNLTILLQQKDVDSCVDPVDMSAGRLSGC
jgi:hypothetical protein